jgi:TfoX/Sxy family transcriptional regulator of competence genes
VPYDEKLAVRVRSVMEEEGPYVEKKMFGGLCFLVRGNMALGVTHEDLMVRVGAEAHEDTLKLKHARPMDFTGRPMKGMVFVGPEGTGAKKNLRAWVRRGLKFAGSLPAK